MEGIDRIRERIIEDAQADATRIKEEATEKARSLKERKIADNNRSNERLIKENEVTAQERKRRLIAAAELEMRKDILKAKQDTIDDVMDKSLAAIKSMPLESYKEIIFNMLMEASSGNEEVIFSKEDRERLDEKFLKEVNKALKKAGKDGKLSLSEEEANFEGGFILKSEGLEINNTFSALLRMSRDRLETELADILFREEG